MVLGNLFKRLKSTPQTKGFIVAEMKKVENERDKMTGKKQ